MNFDIRSISTSLFLAVVGLSPPVFADRIHLSSGRDQAAALQSESAGGTFHSTCISSASFGSNVMENCDSVVLPHNETAVISDPNDPSHLLAGSNDTQLVSLSARTAMGYYTSFDGGRTWLNGVINGAGFAQTADAAVGFDLNGGAFYVMVSFDLGRGGQALGGAIQVAASSDGARTFGTPVTVDESTSDGVFEDKPYLVVDTSLASPFVNNVYVTWTRFVFDSRDNYLESPIFFSASRDGGHTWSAPKEISGRNPALCTFSLTPLPYDGRCREDQFSSPVVAQDGTIFVAFENDQAVNDGNFRDQYLVVSSSDGGESWTAPVRASDLIQDGVNDYPINVIGRQTLSNTQFRVNSAGNLCVDQNSGALFIVWSDNRHGTASSTNTDVFMVSSPDGINWSSPRAVSAAPNDQFYPWCAIGPDGTLNVSFMDRSYDSKNVKYGITLVRQRAGQLHSAQVDTGLSDPNHARWFSSATGGKTTFLGDYTGLAVDGNGVAHPVWTDMRRVVTVRQLTGTTEDIFTAAVP